MKFIKQSDRFTNTIISSSKRERRLKRLLILIIVIIAIAFLFYKFTNSGSINFNSISEFIKSNNSNNSKGSSDNVSIINAEIVEKYPNSRVIAKIDDQPVYDVEIKDILNSKNSNFNELTSSQKKKTIKQYALRKFLVDKAKLEGIDQNFELQIKIKETIKNFMLNKILEDKVSDFDIKQRYKTLSEDIKSQNKIRIKHILVSTEKEADYIRKMLTYSGYNFEKYAKKYSADRRTKDKGGDLGFILESKIPSEFLEAISDLDKGDISKVIKSNSGWHILKLEEIKKAQPASYDKAKAVIEKELKSKVLDEITKDLLGNYKIEIIESINID